MRVSFRVWLLTACVIAWPIASAADEHTPKPPANEDCLACHGDSTAKRASGTSIAVEPRAFEASVHAAMACVDCHQDLAALREFPHPDSLAKVACATCHDSAQAKYATGVHAVARQNGRMLAATCVDCHGMHDIRPSKDPESRTYHLNLPATCGRCHGDPDVIKRGNIAIGNVFSLYRDSIHGKALSGSGLLVAANCSDCHGNHDIRARRDPQSSVYRAHVPETCGKCHEGIQAQYARGVHGTLAKEGSPLAPVCADCHTAHQIKRVDGDVWRLEVIRECGTCHEQSMRTYRDTFHGQVTNLGFTRVAACADCHAPHEIHRVADARSTVSAARIVSTCQRCHPNASASFAKYDPHADPHNRSRNPLLFYSARFMNMLLIGVFAFFGIHTTFWLGRGIYDKRR